MPSVYVLTRPSALQVVNPSFILTRTLRVICRCNTNGAPIRSFERKAFQELSDVVIQLLQLVDADDRRVKDAAVLNAVQLLSDKAISPIPTVWRKSPGGRLFSSISMALIHLWAVFAPHSRAFKFVRYPHSPPRLLRSEIDCSMNPNCFHRKKGILTPPFVFCDCDELFQNRNVVSPPQHGIRIGVHVCGRLGLPEDSAPKRAMVRSSKCSLS